MPIYIDPTASFNGFGDVQRAILTLDADLDTASAGGPSFPAALSLVPPGAAGAPLTFATVPGWLIMAAFVAFLILVNERRG